MARVKLVAGLAYSAPGSQHKASRDDFFRFRCRDRSNAVVDLYYSPSSSELIDSEGTPLLSDLNSEQVFSPASAVCFDRPGIKTSSPRTLKIQLGLSCNYTCEYCNQASQVGDAVNSATGDARRFLDTLDHWLEGDPDIVEFWGGEPLLYFAKLKILVPPLRARWPNARFAMVTNGSLLDGEVVDFFEAYDFHVSVSHDGPGQHVRGPDPFENEQTAHWLRELWRRRGGRRGRVSFNVVLTPANADIDRTRRWLVERIGDEDVILGLEGVVSAYDQGTADGVGKWTDDDYRLMHDALVEGFADGSAFRYLDLRDKARDFIDSLQTLRPSAALGQKCGMERPDQLAVDLQGNVMTCQNTGARGRHNIGHVSRLDEVRLDTATHWSHRTECAKCPVLQLCKGGCMFLEGDLFSRSCENEFHYNLGVLAGIIKSATTLRLEEVSGDFVRPHFKRVIGIAAASAMPASG